MFSAVFCFTGGIINNNRHYTVNFKFSEYRLIILLGTVEEQIYQDLDNREDIIDTNIFL